METTHCIQEDIQKNVLCVFTFIVLIVVLQSRNNIVSTCLDDFKYNISVCCIMILTTNKIDSTI